MKQTPYFFILPSILILAFTSLYPICYSIYYSFFNWRWGNEKDFVGISNYIFLLTDKDFWIIIKNTFVFAFFACLIEIILGVLLAIYIDRIKYGSTIIRTLLLIPLMISGISVTMLFKVILDNMFGIVPYFLSFIGIKSNFFGSYDAAMPTIIGLDVWWQTSFVFIIILAGFQSIPSEPIEAAKMDGASEWEITRYIRLPMIRSLLFLVLIFRSIDTLKVFDINIRKPRWKNSLTLNKTLNYYLPLVDILFATGEDMLQWKNNNSLSKFAKIIHTNKIQHAIYRLNVEKNYVFINNKIYKSNNKRHKTIVNSAGAGDGFNAHYIATFFKTNNVNLALKQGHNIGSKIVKHRSAIIP